VGPHRLTGLVEHDVEKNKKEGEEKLMRIDEY